MKTFFSTRNWYFTSFLALVVTLGCTEKRKAPDTATLAINASVPAYENKAKRPLSEEFKRYWYAGDAEITSYELEQARYGEIRKGKAVLIYVTEPFLKEKQVKADNSGPDNIPVLKLNATKKYLTGIYPYSIMSSTFYPVDDNQHAIKTSLSVQEWCGHVYSQLNNRAQFEFTSHSYFEGEADQKLTLEKAVLENEIWNKIRINPEGLPQGNVSVVPSLEYFRVQHQPVQVYEAEANLITEGDVSTYQLEYKTTSRKLTITFTSAFPHEIQSWEEEFRSGFGPNAKTLISKGTKLSSLKTPYWRQNSNAFVGLRDSLKL
ncbi:MAG: septum formation inhibitor Maf [Bacteroidota bacterium]